MPKSPREARDKGYRDAGISSRENKEDFVTWTLKELTGAHEGYRGDKEHPRAYREGWDDRKKGR